MVKIVEFGVGIRHSLVVLGVLALFVVSCACGLLRMVYYLWCYAYPVVLVVLGYTGLRWFVVTDGCGVLGDF